MIVPKKIFELYKDSRLLDKLYVYARWFFNNFEFMETLVPKKGDILDIGCGYGLLSNYLALNSNERKVIGVDLSKKRIDIAKKSLKGRKNIEFSLENASNITWQKFDGMLMTDFLHHIPYKEQDKIIKYSYKNLKKGAKLVIKDVDKQPTFVYFFHSNIDKFLWNFGAEIYFFTLSNLIKRLKNAGFKVNLIKDWKRAFSCEILLICEK